VIRRSVRGAVALGALATLTLVSTGCSTTLRDAATVRYEDADGETQTVNIRRDTFEDQVEELQASEDVVAGLAQQLPIEEFPAGQADPSLTAFWLSILIQTIAIDAEFDALGLELTDEQIAAAETQVERFGDVPDAFHDVYVDATAKISAITDAMGAEGDGEAQPTTDEEARAFYEENAEQITACPSNKEVAHIMVADEATATDLAAQLAAGADFAELADANSIDAQAGADGTIGCLDTQAFGEEFGTAAEAAAFGEVVGPISSEQGTHLIVVNEWAPTFEKFRDQIVQYLDDQAQQAAQTEGQQAIGEALDARYASLDVSVDPRYGTWGFDEAAQQYQVTAPAPPEPRNQREVRIEEPPGEIPVPELQR
jgi:parvulin-like peptidyl-prolyl isomerase